MFGIMNERNPHGLQGDTDETVEGVAAHFALLCAETGQPRPSHDPAGTYVDDEMWEHAQWAAGEMHPLVSPRAEALEAHLERRLAPCSAFGPDVWGTPDVLAWDSMTLRVVDYKYGHRYVPAVMNPQLIVYAVLEIAAEASRRGIGYGAFDQCVKCELSIVQPRSFGHAPVRTWTVLATDLRGTVNQLTVMAERARADSPQATSGDHCRYCPGRLACSAHVQSVGEGLDISYATSATLTPDVRELSERLRVIRAAAVQLESQQAALEGHLLTLAQSGLQVPGWHIEHSKGKRAWTADVSGLFAVGEMLGVDLRSTAPVSPAQAEKLGVPRDLIDAYASAGTGPAKLVRDDLDQIKTIFGA